jgi:ribosomal protein S18 acetylase RimI-like enzyme
MIKLPKLNYAARKLLSFSPLQYMFDAVTENPQLAEIYADDEKEIKRCALLLGHYLFLSNADEKFISELYETVFQKERQTTLGALIVFYDSNDTAEFLKKTFNKVYNNMRSVYQCGNVQTGINKSDKVIPITEELLNSDIENTKMITQEVLGTATYGDMKDFCQNGIGYTFADQNRICGFCTSEYPSKSSLAIGIEVDEKYQRQGIATEMTKAFLREASNRKLNVFWECWQGNEASVHTALKCGFKKMADYPVLVIVKPRSLRERQVY